MSRLVDNPLMLLTLLLVIVLLFGAPRLPGMARNLGQSLRIFRSEVQEMKKDDQPRPSCAVANIQPGTEDAEASGASRP